MSQSNSHYAPLDDSRNVPEAPAETSQSTQARYEPYRQAQETGQPRSSDGLSDPHGQQQQQQQQQHDGAGYTRSHDYQYDPHTMTAATTEYGGASEMHSMIHDTKLLQNKVQASDPDDKMPFWRAVRRYPRLVGYCFAVTTAILGWGYASLLVTSINNVDQFLYKFGEEFDGDWQIPGMWLSVWMACDAGGGALGAAAGGWLQDRFGRRMSLVIGGVWSAIGVVTVFVADMPPNINGRRGMFLVGKMTAGFATGIIKTTAMTYVSENSPTALRGSAMALFPTFTLLGQGVGTGVIMGIRRIPSAANYRIAFSTEWFFSILAVCLGVFLPESPSHLVRKNRMSKAMESARKLYAPHASPEHELDRIVASVRKETENTRRPGYFACFHGVNARRTWIIVFTNVLPAMFGLDLLSSASYFLLTIGLPSNVSLLFQLLGIGLAIFANAASVWLLSRVGRRTATIPSLAAATLLWTGMGVSGFFTGTGAQYLTAVSMISVILVCGLGAWPAGYAIMGETSSLSLRAKSQAIGSIAAQLTSVVMSFGLPLVFSRDAANLGSKTGFVYTGLCGVAALTSWLFIPEMKGRSALEIDHMFAIGLPARRFKSWNGVAPVPA